MPGDTIHLDVVTDWNQRSIHQTAQEIENTFGRAGRDSAAAYAKGYEQNSAKIEKAYRRTIDAAGDVAKADRSVVETRGQIARQTKTLESAEKRLTDVKKDGASTARDVARAEREVEQVRTRLERTTTTLVNRSETLRRARRNEESSARDLARSMTDVDTTTRGAVTQLSVLGTTLGGLGRVATPVVVAGAVSGIAQLTAVAASATQALWVMPGAIGAAASAFGTLKLATVGFSDAIEDIRDPEKFATALQSLSPNAQQAALSIQALLPEFDKLKNATQDALFAGVGEQLNQLTNQYLPTIQTMTTGIAGAFNQMFTGVANQMMTPETLLAMQTFATNTAAAFNNLAPAAGDLVSAFADLSAVGSDFLPDIASAAADAAGSFADFIREASNSGELKQWLGDGLQTLRQLWPAVESVGQAFMNLAPIGQRVLPDVVAGIQGLADILPGVVDFATQLAPAFGEAGKALSWLADVGDTAFKGLEDSGVSAFGAIGDSIARVLNPLNAVLDAFQVVGNLLGFDMGGGTASAADNAQRRLDAAIAEMRNPGWGGPPAHFPGQQQYSGGGYFGPPGTRPTSAPLLDRGAERGNSTIPFVIPPYPTNGYTVPMPTPPMASSGASSAASSYTPPNAYVAAAIELAQRSSGNTAYGPASDLVGGLADCSGSISDLVEVLKTGQSSPARLFTTTNFASDADAAKLGFLPGYMPGALNVGVNPYPGQSGHMAATLPNGVNFEGGGGTGGGAQYGGSAAGALDPQFQKHYYLPVDGAFNGGYGVPPDSGPTPVTVENFGPSAQTSIGQIGAQLDADFGLSNGLPGLLENLTRAAANLAFAPVVGALSGVQAGLGFQPGSAGSGLAGMMAPAFGYGAPPMGAPGLGAAPMGMPGAAAPFMGSPATIGPSPLGGGIGAPLGTPAAPGTPASGMGFGTPPGTGMPGAIQPMSSVIGGGLGGAPQGAQGSGFAGLGGLPMAAIQTGIAAAGTAGAPFGGQAAAAAAQMGIELANRTAALAGQVGGILAQGALETFSLSGSAPLSDPLKTLPGRLLAGFAGARPNIPNMAGQPQQAGVNPQDTKRGADAIREKQGGPLVNIENVNQAPNQKPDAVANSVANQFRSRELSVGYPSR